MNKVSISPKNQNYNLRQTMFGLLTPMCGVGGYTLDGKMEKARYTTKPDDAKPPIYLLSYNDALTKGAQKQAAKEILNHRKSYDENAAATSGVKYSPPTTTF